MVFDEDQARLGGLPIFGFAARSAIIIKRRFSTAKESYWTTEQPAMPNRAFPHTLKVLGDPEQIETVRLGTRALKAWRKNHPKIRLNLRGANLRGLNLATIDLSGAHFGATKPSEQPATLCDTVLREARLQGVCFRMADLSNADLENADLCGSQLSIADFSYANLRGADLSETILIATNFHRATLDQVDLTSSIVGHTRFTAMNLSTIRGLSTIRHEYPSTIDIDTLFGSAEAVPESFLRGCGVPDTLITNLRALVGAMEPIQFDSCFISFSHKDEAFAERLHSRLRDSGVRVWFAPEDIKGGRKLYDQIDRAIQVHDRLLLVLSDHSINSHWVVTEIRRALATEAREKRRKLFPIRLCDMTSLSEWTCFDADSGKDLAVEVREYFIPDFSNWKNHDTFEGGFERLLRDLRASSEGEHSKRQARSSSTRTRSG